MTRPSLIIFARAPVAGRVKTRLGREIGMTAAAWWYRHQLSRLLRAVGGDRRWRTLLAVTPDRAACQPRLWPAPLPCLPQGPGDLGARMLRALAAVSGPAILIGSDIPGVGRAHVAEAFRCLAGHDAVIGPAADGGFWLIGFTRPRQIAAGLFEGVRWSTPDARADTLGALAGLRVATAREMQDVDAAADLATAGRIRGICL